MTSSVITSVFRDCGMSALNLTPKVEALSVEARFLLVAVLLHDHTETRQMGVAEIGTVSAVLVVGAQWFNAYFYLTYSNCFDQSSMTTYKECLLFFINFVILSSHLINFSDIYLLLVSFLF